MQMHGEHAAPGLILLGHSQMLLFSYKWGRGQKSAEKNANERTLRYTTVNTTSSVYFDES